MIAMYFLKKQLPYSRIHIKRHNEVNKFMLNFLSTYYIHPIEISVPYDIFWGCIGLCWGQFEKELIGKPDSKILCH